MQQVERQIEKQPQAPRAIDGPNQGLDPHWIHQVRRGDAEGLGGVGEGLHAVARSVDTFPARVVEQTQLVEYAFGAGACLGFVGCLIVWFLASMMRRPRGLVLLAAIALTGAVGCDAQPSAPVVPAIDPDPQPLPDDPTPNPKPCPGPGPCPPRDFGDEEKHVAPDGRTEAQIDYPVPHWIKNIGSRIDGAGMCVFSSAEMSFRWAGLEEMRGFRDWCAEHYPGGGYPDKLHKLILAYCKAKQIPTQDQNGITWILRPRTGERWTYVQTESGSMALAEAALREGTLACSTLYNSPRYGSGTIYHMVNLAHWGPGSWGAILDNNFRPYEWDRTASMYPRLCMRGTVWLVAVIRHGPPPPPS